MNYDYAELEGVIYRAENDPDDPDGRYEFTEKLVGGKWAGVADDRGDKAAMFGRLMTEAEAKDFAGDEWPRN